MVEYFMHENNSTQLDQTFAALADPTRRAILARLMEGEARVTEIAAPFEMSLNAVSKHLRVLEGAGLVRRKVKGRDHHISIDGGTLADAAELLEFYRQFWDTRLDRLARFLSEQHAGRSGRET